MLRRFQDGFLVLVSVAVLFSGCSKHETSSNSPPAKYDLGTVNLAYGTPARQVLGNGSACIFKAETLGPGNIELFTTLEKDGKEVATTRNLPVKSDQPMHLSFGNVEISFTPHVTDSGH